MKKTFLRWMACALTLVVLAVCGCNTVRGVGKDIERGGEKIQDVAE